VTAMIDRAPPDGVEVLIKWLSPLGEVRDERPTGAVLPYRMVNRIGGGSDRIVDRGTYSIHTFAATKELAQAASIDTHRRLFLLAGQFQDQQKVTLNSGQVVQADDVICDEFPVRQQWVKDNSIERFVGTYTVPLRYVAI
jgi:hypothetical protein